MRYTFVFTILLSTFLSFPTVAQETKIYIRSIGKDSVNLPFDNNYYITQETCADIIRYGHFDFQRLKFFGKVKDVSKDNPDLTVAEAFYNIRGQIDGEFISRYTNGNLQAKGTFKENKYCGKWEVYFEDGKPKIFFSVDNDDVFTINEVWTPKGKKTVDNGAGTYWTINDAGLTLTGKLVNGRPEGKWTLSNSILNRPLITEHFKHNQFVKGESLTCAYTDKSKLILVNRSLLSFTQAENMIATTTPCTGDIIHLENAKYKDGFEAFSRQIARLVSEYLNSVDISIYNNKMVIEGIIDKNGVIGSFRGTSVFNNTILRGIINKLQYLPTLEPATINGQAVPQKISIDFTFNQGQYSFSYRFLPL